MINENGTFIEDAPIPEATEEEMQALLNGKIQESQNNQAIVGVPEATQEEMDALLSPQKSEEQKLIDQETAGMGTLENPLPGIPRVEKSYQQSQAAIESQSAAGQLDVTNKVKYDSALGAMNKIGAAFHNLDYKQLEQMKDKYGFKNIAMSKDFGVMIQKQDDKWYQAHIRIKGTSDFSSTEDEKKWNTFVRTGNTELETDWYTEIPGFIPEALATVGIEGIASLAIGAIPVVGELSWAARAAIQGGKLLTSGALGHVVGEEIREASGKAASGVEKTDKETLGEKAVIGGVGNVAGAGAIHLGSYMLKGLRSIVTMGASALSGLKAMVGVARENPLSATAFDTAEALDAFKKTDELLDAANTIAKETYTSSMTKIEDDKVIMASGIRAKEAKALAAIDEAMEGEKKALSDTKKLKIEEINKEKAKAKIAHGNEAIIAIGKEKVEMEAKLAGSKVKMAEKIKLKQAEQAAREGVLSAEGEALQSAFIESKTIETFELTNKEFKQSVQSTLSDGWAKVEKELSNPMETVVDGQKVYVTAPLEQKLPPDSGLMYAKKEDGSAWELMQDLGANGRPRNLINAISDKLDEVGLSEANLGAAKVVNVESKAIKIAANVKEIVEIITDKGEVSAAIASIMPLIKDNVSQQLIGKQGAKKVTEGEMRELTVDTIRKRIKKSFVNISDADINMLSAKIYDMPKEYLPFIEKGNTYGGLFKLSSFLRKFKSEDGLLGGLGDLADVIDSRIMVQEDIRIPLRQRSTAYAETVNLFKKIKGDINNQSARWFSDLFNDPKRAQEFGIYLNELEKRVYDNYGAKDVVGIKKVKAIFNEAKELNTIVSNLDSKIKTSKEMTDNAIARIKELEKELSEKHKARIESMSGRYKQDLKSEGEMIDELYSRDASRIEHEYAFDKRAWDNRKVSTKNIYDKETKRAEAIFEIKKTELENQYKIAQKGIDEQKKLASELEDKIGLKMQAAEKAALASGDGQIMANVASLNATRRGLAVVASMLGGNGNKAAKTITFWNLKSMAAKEASMLPYEMVKPDSVLRVKTPIGKATNKVAVTAKDVVIGYENIFVPKRGYNEMGTSWQKHANTVAAIKELGFKDTAAMFFGFTKALGGEFEKMRNLNTLVKEMNWGNELKDGSVTGLGRMVKDLESLVEEAYGTGAAERFYKGEWNKMQIERARKKLASDAGGKIFADIIEMRKRIGEWSNNAIKEREVLDQQISIYEKTVMGGGQQR